MHIRIRLFRIWYSSTYTVLFFVLIVLLAVTPGDTIWQSFKNDNVQKIITISAVYLLTSLITLLVYSTRLYTNRSVLQGIPKAYIPVEDGEVGKSVRRMIVKALRRSATVAWDSRPRDVRNEAGTRPSTADRPSKRRSHHREGTIIPVNVASPQWGHVSHPGWSSPASDDLPNLQYWTVVPELPNLIEAKAVSLAPPDPAVDLPLHPQSNTPILPDAQIVALLQRPGTMGLRDYLGRLSSFGLINPPSLGPKFLAQYEYARFSASPLTEIKFRNLMAVFAEILGGMTQIHEDILAELRADAAESETRSLAPSESSHSSDASAIRYRTPRAMSQPFERTYSNASYPTSMRNRTESPETLRTAPSHLPRTPSHTSLGSVRIHSVARSPSTILPNSSSSSSSSDGSLRSAQSVIRLNNEPQEGELPYQIHFDGS